MATPISRSATQTADSAGQPVEQSAGEVAHAESEATFCPHCHASVLPEGDICEACGGSLLPGQCRFCYAAVPDGAAFCAECGCSQSGVMCACGTLNFFDFCSNCSKPLTEAAQLAAAAVADDPKIRALLEALRVEALREAPAEESRGRPDSANGIGGLSGGLGGPGGPAGPGETASAGGTASGVGMRSDTAPPAAPRRGMFSDQQRQALRGLTSLVQEMQQGEQKQRDADRAQREAEAARQRAQEELQRVQAAEQEQLRQRQLQIDQERSAVARRGDGIARSIAITSLIRPLLDDASSRTFADAQEARRFTMALIESIPGVRGLSVRGWLCNRFNCMHANPNGCSAPQFGGKWIVDP